MSLPTRFHPLADSEYGAAIRWYRERDPKLAADFESAVDEAMTRTRAAPLRCPVVRHETRRVLVRRFPYAVFYVPKPNEIRVLAVFHHRRDPKQWHMRR
jgi:plasmid stabilization system protein ParE